MEKGGDSSSGFKKSSSNRDFVSSMKLQTSSTEAFPSKISMMATLNLDRPFVGEDGVGGGGGSSGGGFVGPTNKSGGANEVVANIYRDDVSSSASASAAAAGGCGENFAKIANLQPFEIFPSSLPYKSPAGEMATGVRFPFTAAQWKELERQALIYKCMISSVPVPPYLLLPLATNFSASATVHSSVSSIYSGRYSKNGDPEPGRCKRTDGKKWRCSREVAPHQKYCERHLHRGRPRSRKPVEVKNNGENHKKTRLEPTKSLPTVQSNGAASPHFVAANEPLSLLNAQTALSISTPYFKETSRDLGLTTQGEIVSTEQPWEDLMEANMGLANEGFADCSSSASVLNQNYVVQQPLNVNVLSYPKFSAPEIELPTGFIDAWSIDNLNSRNDGNVVQPSISLNEGDLSPSLNLSMAMAAGNVLDREMRNIQTGSGVEGCADHKTKDSMWLSPVCWEPFARGGPLGEALQLGSIAIGGSNPASPYNSIGTPATTVSSPSGVLHWTLFSHSDSSVCNSPTFVAHPSEVSNQWHN